MKSPTKVLQIGNYPPPMCGWAIQLKLVTEELRRRGHICEILKINEGRQIKSPEYVDVQSGLDYIRKIWSYSRRGYRLNVHVNGMSKKGYCLALAAALTGRIAENPALVTFHGGLAQDYFPRRAGFARWAFYLLFNAAGSIACDSEVIKNAIEKYGLSQEKVQAIGTFSAQYLNFRPVGLSNKIEDFLSKHPRIIVSYLSFRPEYRLEILRQAMRLYGEKHPDAGFVWLGFPAKELPQAEQFVHAWPDEERSRVLVIGNLPHDEFLTLLRRSFIFLRTPVCDGVCASVLEALGLRVAVVASENGRRPAGVITYDGNHAADMTEKLKFVTECREEIRRGLHLNAADDNIGRMADWLAGEHAMPAPSEAVATH